MKAIINGAFITDEEKKKLLIEQIEGIDFDLMKELYENTMKPLVTKQCL